MIINNNKEFELEDFLSEEMEYSKMTPSSAVWDRISKEVQPQYRWLLWVLTILMLFVPYSLVMYYLPTNNGLSVSSSNTAVTPANNPPESAINKTVASSFNRSNNGNDHVTDEPLITAGIVDENAVKSTNNLSDGLMLADNNNNLLNAEAVRLNKLYLPLPALGKINITSLAIKNKKQVKATVDPIAKKKSSKYTVEVYATPSVSYRSLNDDKTRLQYYRDIYRNNPFTDNIAAKNVNTIVNQRAGMGKEIGVGTRIALNSKLKLKAGLQFNAQQYTTEAYHTNGTANFAYVKNNLLDSVSANALYATAGTQKVTLNNTLYQLSMPIGVQWDCVRKNKFSLGIGASLQPSYILQDNSFVVSTDYKYFSKSSTFSKNWNLNSAVDLSFNYSNKDFIWYFAPQFRYQLGATYKDIYSIKEHRWELGLKVGVVKTF